MKHLTQFIIENCQKPDFLTDVKISFRGDWDEEGTHYTRMVSLKCSEEELTELNKSIGAKFEFGKNFSKLTVSSAFDKLIGLEKSKVGQHNTIFKFIKK